MKEFFLQLGEWMEELLQAHSQNWNVALTWGQNRDAICL